MLQLSPAAPRVLTPVPPDDLAEPFLRFAGASAHALVAGTHPLPLICALIQGGCRAATSIRPGEKPDDDSYDLLLIPRSADFTSLDPVVRLACRSLAPNGRLLVAIADPGSAALLDRRLQLNGFALSASLPHGSPKGLQPGLLLCFDRRGPRS